MFDVRQLTYYVWYSVRPSQQYNTVLHVVCCVNYFRTLYYGIVLYVLRIVRSTSSQVDYHIPESVLERVLHHPPLKGIASTYSVGLFIILDAIPDSGSCSSPVAHLTNYSDRISLHPLSCI
jgi:hypothetical protein